VPARDNARVGSDAPRWSGDVHQADWIAPRLAPWDGGTITIVVPAGFEAYARVLHPAETPGNGDHLVRWADVAAWSGMPLREDAQCGLAQHVQGIRRRPAATTARDPQGGAAHRGRGARGQWQHRPSGTPRERRGDPARGAPLPYLRAAGPHRNVTPARSPLAGDTAV
jgi:hypothetical protein